MVFTAVKLILDLTASFGKNRRVVKVSLKQIHRVECRKKPKKKLPKRLSRRKRRKRGGGGNQRI